MKKTKQKQLNEKYKSIIKNLERTKYEISEIDLKLNYVTDAILMNQLIYQRKASEMKYRYWYKLAKEHNIERE